MESEIFSRISKNKAYGMDDVIRKTINKKKFASSFITKKNLQIQVTNNHIEKQMKNMLRKLGKRENRNE